MSNTTHAEIRLSNMITRRVGSVDRLIVFTAEVVIPSIPFHFGNFLKRGSQSLVPFLWWANNNVVRRHINVIVPHIGGIEPEKVKINAHYYSYQ